MKKDYNKKIKVELAKKINETLSSYDLWITRKQLAKMAGISESTLYLVLKGMASVDSTINVCKVLNIKLSWDEYTCVKR